VSVEIEPRQYSHSQRLESMYTASSKVERTINQKKILHLHSAHLLSAAPSALE
jgi:hypothetical protein